jgi:hypothetical protein
MLNGIVVDVIHVVLHVVIITDAVFPVSSLPDRFLLFPTPRARNCCSTNTGTPMGEIALEQTPSGGVVGIIHRECPYRVQMIGKDDIRVNDEWMPDIHIVEGAVNELDVINQTEDVLPFVRDDGKEIGSSGSSISAIFHDEPPIYAPPM